MTKYLIFDFDGVIANTLVPAATAYQKIHNDSRDIKSIINTNFVENSKHSHFFGENNANSEEVANSRREVAIAIGNEIVKGGFQLFDPLIVELSKMRLNKLAIVSSGTENLIQEGIKKSNLTFDYAFGCETHLSKRQKIQMVCDNWEVEVSEVFYFTDTQADVRELEGFVDSNKIIGCAWGWHGYELLRELLPADQILEDAFEIHRVIDNQDAQGEEKYNKNLLKNNKKQIDYEIERQRRLVVKEQKAKLITQFLDENAGGEKVVGKESFGMFVGDKRSYSDLVDESIVDEQVKDEDYEDYQDAGYEEITTRIELEKKYILLDSTGIRRPGQRTFGAESFATFRTIEEAYAADVICMVVDGSEPLAHQDQVVAGIVKEAKKGVVVIVNKADLVPAENRVRFQSEFEHKFQFLKVKKFVWVSAVTKIGLNEIWDNIDLALEERNKDISRDELRKIFNYLMKQKPPKKLRLEKRPVVYDLLYNNDKTPTFELLVKNRMTVHWSYLRFLENTLRTNFGFENTEIKVKAVNVSRKKVMG